ncbi:MAG TPA: YIP1 family protein [Caldilineaceae bacterium]|nr:YIP1 family protein [Caldilineaceae bacterium]
MLRPRTYPELIGKALVLEAQPFTTMAEDDEPWVEGLVLVVSIGVLVALAKLVGGLLLTASLPPADAVLAALLNAWQEFMAQVAPSADLAASEAQLRQAWSTMLLATGYGGGWERLLGLIFTPLGLIVQWLAAALIVFVVARLLGGRGTLNQTLGATALMVAPQVLLLVEVVPFVSVSSLLLLVWGMLILYRAVEVAHELPWRSAALTAVVPYALLILILLVIATVASLALRLGGFQ